MLWSGKRHPKNLGQPEEEAFLTDLAYRHKVARSTHRQALSALLFLCREVLSQPLPWLKEIGRPPERKRIPSVLTPDEVLPVLGAMHGMSGLLVRMLCGTGIRKVLELLGHCEVTTTMINTHAQQEPCAGSWMYYAPPTLPLAA